MKNRLRIWTCLWLAVAYFAVACSFKLANFEAMSTRPYVTDKNINFIFKMYIQLSLICDQSQLSSSIRLEMAIKSK